jgi:hypothetical protein
VSWCCDVVEVGRVVVGESRVANVVVAPAGEYCAELCHRLDEGQLAVLLLGRGKRVDRVDRVGLCKCVW